MILLCICLATSTLYCIVQWKIWHICSMTAWARYCFFLHFSPAKCTKQLNKDIIGTQIMYPHTPCQEPTSISLWWLQIDNRGVQTFNETAATTRSRMDTSFKSRRASAKVYLPVNITPPKIPKRHFTLSRELLNCWIVASTNQSGNKKSCTYKQKWEKLYSILHCYKTIWKLVAQSLRSCWKRKCHPTKQAILDRVLKLNQNIFIRKPQFTVNEWRTLKRKVTSQATKYESSQMHDTGTYRMSFTV